jgi:hypothetical protein
MEVSKKMVERAIQSIIEEEIRDNAMMCFVKSKEGSERIEIRFTPQLASESATKKIMQIINSDK